MYRLLLLSLLFLGSLRAQTTEKGSSSENPWNREVQHGAGGYMDYTFPIRCRYYLSFGEWKFDSKFISPTVKSVVTDADPGIFAKALSRVPSNHRNAKLVYKDSIHVNAMAPGAIPYGLYFSYTDSLIEQYLQVVLSFQHMETIHFYRKLRGTVQYAAGDVSPFYISVVYIDFVMHNVSYVLAGKDTIFMKAVSKPTDDTVNDLSGGRHVYEGFDFYENDTLVGSAHRKYNFAGMPIYVYWFNPQLNLQQQEAIAAMIFLIAGFIE